MADRIRVETGCFEDIALRLKGLASSLNQLEGELRSVQIDRISGAEVSVQLPYGSLKSVGCGIRSGNAQSCLRNLAAGIGKLDERIGVISQNVKEAGLCFSNTERMLTRRFEGLGVQDGLWKYGSAQNGAYGGGISGWFDAFGDKLCSAVDSLKNGICSGIGAVQKFLGDCKAYWEDNWNNKGWIYKTVKATGAVLNIVGSVAVAVSTITAAVAAVAGSGGAAAPVVIPVVTAVLATLYNGNSALNSVADLVNLFGGDINQVGQVNLLKSGLTAAYGKAGELVGYKEAGESVGEMVYTVGGVTSAILSVKQLAGKVIQTNSLNLGKTGTSAANAIKEAWKQNAAPTMKEAKFALSGVKDLFTKTPISQVRLQASLLKGQLAMMESTGEGMKLLSVIEHAGIVNEATKTATQLVDAGIEVANLTNETLFHIVHNGNEAAVEPVKLIKSDEAAKQFEKSAIGIAEKGLDAIVDLKKDRLSQVQKGVNKIQNIVQELVNAKEEWDFYSRTRVQGG